MVLKLLIVMQRKKDKKRIGSHLYQKLGSSIKIEDPPGALN